MDAILRVIAMLMSFIADSISILLGSTLRMFSSVLSAAFIFLAKLFMELFNINVNAYFDPKGGIIPELIEVYTPVFKAIGFAVLILIATWHIFKGFFSFLGLGTEPEEAWKIGLKCLMFGIILMFSTTICKEAIVIFDQFVDVTGFDTSKFNLGVIDVFVGELDGLFDVSQLSSSNSGLEELGISTIDTIGSFSFGEFFDIVKLVILLCFCLTLIGISIDLAGKYLKIAILIIIAPISIACGVTKATNQIFTAWVKSYIGVLVSVFIKYFLLGVFMDILPNSMGGINFIVRVKNFVLFMCFMTLVKQSDTLVNELGFTAGMTPGGVSALLGKVAGHVASYGLGKAGGMMGKSKSSGTQVKGK